MPKSKEQKQLEAQRRNLVTEINILNHRIKTAENVCGNPEALGKHEKWLIKDLDEHKEKLKAKASALANIETTLKSQQWF